MDFSACLIVDRVQNTHTCKTYTFLGTMSQVCDLNVLLDGLYQPICLYTTKAQYRTCEPQITNPQTAEFESAWDFCESFGKITFSPKLHVHLPILLI